MLRIDGNSALVTGASRGIGAASALRLAQSGVKRIAIHYNSHRPGAEQVAEDVRKAGAEVTLMQADLASVEGIHQFIADLKGKEFDILVNNAGHLVGRATLMDATEDLFDRIMNLNVKSAYFIAQAVAPYMVSQGSGVIVNLSSIAARHGGGIGASLYSASKAAVANFTKGMAKELAPKGVRVNAISPGTVDNDFHVKYSTADMMKNMLATCPLGRLGTNEDIADVILFLCSDGARYVHGQTIEVNGGMWMA
jgi:3-oxoacyl-[acyl-carrier protein] reductase